MMLSRIFADIFLFLVVFSVKYSYIYMSGFYYESKQDRKRSEKKWQKENILISKQQWKMEQF